MKNIGACSLSFLLLVFGCTASPIQSEMEQGSQMYTPIEELINSPDQKVGELQNQIEQIASTAQGRVGVAVTLLGTEKSMTLNGDQRFPMQSVYKFPIGMAVLSQVDQGKLRLDQRVVVETRDFVSEGQHSPIRDEYPQGVELSLAELLKYMVSESDGTACDVLLGLVGGPDVVTEYLRELGVNGIVVANTEKEIGQDKVVQYQNYATPDAAIVLLRVLHEGQDLSEASQALLLQLMTETPTGSQRIKGLLPDETVVAHKTGTSLTVDGITAATNNVGLVTLPNGRHFAISVFVSDSTADATIREGVIAQVARAAWDEWSQ
ncbi:MAG: class A beta-lactamase, subclass A2 [Leptolyngbya sp. SIO1D8]|nr:class A beta-lactamase, subclass A2 [Leptolyngbya sp. SIO1D8]